MKPSTLLYMAFGLLSPITTSAIEINVDDPGTRFASIPGLN